MAYIKAAAICTRLKEVLVGGLGVARTITIGRYSEDAPDGLDENEDRRRALAVPIVRARLQNLRRAAASPPVMGNFLIYEGVVEVEIKRLVSTEEQLDEDARRALEALCIEDADVVRQALEYPGNLTTTAAGTATDIASGMLTHVVSEYRSIGLVNEGAQSATGIHRFTGKFFARPA